MKLIKNIRNYLLFNGKLRNLVEIKFILSALLSFIFSLRYVGRKKNYECFIAILYCLYNSLKIVLMKVQLSTSCVTISTIINIAYTVALLLESHVVHYGSLSDSMASLR